MNLTRRSKPEITEEKLLYRGLRQRKPVPGGSIAANDLEKSAEHLQGVRGSHAE
jgi:hypothetical protein